MAFHRQNYFQRRTKPRGPKANERIRIKLIGLSQENALDQPIQVKSVDKNGNPTNVDVKFIEFDPEKISQYRNRKIEALLTDKGIIRNRMKVNAAVKNAESFLKIQKSRSSFSKYIWQFTDQKTIVNSWNNENQIPASTAESDAMSKQLKQDGFSFVGTTICYAFMQAAGMVNDHLTTCFRYSEL